MRVRRRHVAQSLAGASALVCGLAVGMASGFGASEEPKIGEVPDLAVADLGSLVDEARAVASAESDGLKYVLAPGAGRAAGASRLCFAVLKAESSSVACGNRAKWLAEGAFVTEIDDRGGRTIRGFTPVGARRVSIEGERVALIGGRFFRGVLPPRANSILIETAEGRVVRLPTPPEALAP